MMSLKNNPAVSLTTRGWLQQLAQEGRALDPPSLALIRPLLEKVRFVHPGGLVYGVASDLGAPQETAFIAVSLAELFYAACSDTDFLQDGDTGAYPEQTPLSLQINAQAHLLCLVAIRLNDLAAAVPPRRAGELTRNLYRTPAIMLTGQRLELTRENWDAQAFERVTRYSAGEQFGSYLSFAAAAADVDPEDLLVAGRAFGNMLQVIADVESRDPRFVALPEADRKMICDQFQEELHFAARKCNNAFVEEQLTATIRRWNQCSQSN